MALEVWARPQVGNASYMVVERHDDVTPPEREDVGSGTPFLAVIGEYPAVAASVRQAREAVARLAEEHGGSAPRIDDIRLAVSEAATNVVMHAYQQGDRGHFRVLSVVGRRKMLVVVDDDGCGLSTPACTPGLGAGLDVMRQVAEDARFCERANGGSTVQMRLALTD